MCTVTLIPSPGHEKGFILTSNRDEAAGRKAFAPHFYSEMGIKMLYPKDTEAGGTWIGLSERCRLICLLNGGFENHTRREKYRKSRGVVVKELLAAPDVFSELDNYDFTNIEPFTLIIADWKADRLFAEFVWDGGEKYLKMLAEGPHVWSSSPLYDNDMKDLRSGWFREFLNKQKLTAEDLWEFHHSGGEGNKEVDLIMDRGFVKTQSITQVENLPQYTRMKYKDLSEEKISITDFEIKSDIN